MNIKNLSMSFGNQELFNDINIQIDENQKVGVIGLNGAGKTTLFKIIMGKEYPDKGKITFKNNARVEWLPQVIEDDLESLDISVLDYLMSARPIEKLNNQLQDCYERLGSASLKEQKDIFNEIDKIQKRLIYWDQYNADGILLKIIDGMNIDDSLLDKKIHELSGGQKSKITFAKLLYSKPEVMLLDEPTNHLDKDTKDYVINYLKSYNGSVYIISHDIDFLNKVVNKILYLDKITKKFELYDGNYDKFIKLHTEHEKALERQMKLQQQEENKLREIVLHYSNSSGNRKKMAQDREKKLEKLLSNKIEIGPKDKKAKIDISINRESSKIPLVVERISFSYDKKKPIIKDLSFSLSRGEKFLIVGKNGVGKSTLLKLIINQLQVDKGRIVIGNKTDIGYYAQEHELLDDDKTIMENFKEYKLSNEKLRNHLGRFLFNNDEVFKKVKVLSPGEKSRVALAKLSLSKANFLILDEPTNHLDPTTQKIIAETFRDFKGTMLVVSHNPEFVDNLGIERVLELPKGKISFYDKDYVDYYSKLNENK